MKHLYCCLFFVISIFFVLTILVKVIMEIIKPRIIVKGKTINPMMFPSNGESHIKKEINPIT